jgi:Flp pilus assembly pilin Flp
MLKAAAWKQTRQPREEGQTLIEYALVVAVVSIALAAAMVLFGKDIITSAKAEVTDYLGTL